MSTRYPDAAASVFSIRDGIHPGRPAWLAQQPPRANSAVSREPRSRSGARVRSTSYVAKFVAAAESNLALATRVKLPMLTDAAASAGFRRPRHPAW
ncbi:hypothetical protein, partial [Microbacterium sp.]|uniref:hypothetical protein n=1 Tax=Microbacterium sp. TaxID=51671 RepID=UPI002632AFAB